MAKRGFLVLAQNSDRTDYLRLAYGLALSLKLTQREPIGVSVIVTPGQKVPKEWRPVFDQVLEVQWGDDAKFQEWKIHNKWKIVYDSPYEETIFCDADMLVPVDMTEWWSLLKRTYPVITCAIPHRHDGTPIVNSAYREWFRFNNLPPVYTGLMYFRQDPITMKFFKTVEKVFKGWHHLRTHNLGLPAEITGDIGFAVAMSLSDIPVVQHPLMSFTHMKARDLGIGEVESWREELPAYVKRDGSILVKNHNQGMPFHYVDKDFLTDEVIEILGGAHV